METSSFLFETFPYSILIWLHFGTNLLISFSYLFYVLPIVFNIIVIVLPRFNFGFMKQKEGTGSGSTVIPADLNKTLADSKVFAHAYSRNPKLFSTLPMQEVGNFFSGLDDKLSNISNVLKDFPVAEESKKDEQNPEKSNTKVSAQQMDDYSAESENIDEESTKEDKAKKTKKKKEKKESSAKTTNKNLLLYGNLVFLVAIVGMNVYGYFHYNSLFNEYFVEKKSMFKDASLIYELDYKKVLKIKDSTKTETLLEIDGYVQIINSVKEDKFIREKKEEKEENKDSNKK